MLGGGGEVDSFACCAADACSARMRVSMLQSPQLVDSLNLATSTSGTRSLSCAGSVRRREAAIMSGAAAASRDHGSGDTSSAAQRASAQLPAGTRPRRLTEVQLCRLSMVSLVSVLACWLP